MKSMEAYKNPEMLKAPHDWNWEDRTLDAWVNGAQHTVLGIMRELYLQNDDSAYNLGKNLWYNGKDEDEIREQLTKYAQASK